MNRLQPISRVSANNISGLDLIRLIDVRDVEWIMPAEEVWRGPLAGVLPTNGFVPRAEATWVDFYFLAGTANHVETMLRSEHGPAWKEQLTLPIAFDSPKRAEAVRLLSRGRWLALRMDGNEVIRLIGTLEQPLKLNAAAMTTSGANGWSIELGCLTLAQAYYLENWDPETIYGDPADFSFEFLNEFNS